MIYAIQVGDDGPVKIGRAKNPASRMYELQIASPFRLKLLAECNWHDQNEEILHHHLRESYIRGEWFEPSEDVLEVVSLMRGNDFEGLGKKIGLLSEMPRFDKKAYQREYMRTRRANAEAVHRDGRVLGDEKPVEPAQGEVAGQVARSSNRRGREAYNAYQREYMKALRKKRALR
jgi:hypothetical protein